MGPPLALDVCRQPYSTNAAASAIISQRDASAAATTAKSRGRWHKSPTAAHANVAQWVLEATIPAAEKNMELNAAQTIVRNRMICFIRFSRLSTTRHANVSHSGAAH
jgi:hypothetical protein